jgi:hypothetical protein
LIDAKGLWHNRFQINLLRRASDSPPACQQCSGDPRNSGAPA